MVRKAKAQVKETEKDPVKLKKYEDAASDITNMYINQWFGSSEMHPDIIRKSEGDDFEILSTIRYDPLLSSHCDLSTDINYLMREFGNQIDFLEGSVFSNSRFEATSENDYNSQLYFLFDEHFERINFSLRYFKFGIQVDRVELLQNLSNVLNPLNRSKPYRLRVTVSKKGDVNISAHDTPIRLNLLDGLLIASVDDYIAGGSPLWSVHLDSEPILISPFTSFKTTRREQYNAARDRKIPKLQLSELQANPHEVLLFNTANQLTEGSITNIAVKKYDEDANDFVWFTPVLASGCLCGVVRYMLLSKGLIKEKLLTLKDIRVGDDILLFNGLIGVVKGRIVED